MYSTFDGRVTVHQPSGININLSKGPFSKGGGKLVDCGVYTDVAKDIAIIECPSLSQAVHNAYECGLGNPTGELCLVALHYSCQCHKAHSWIWWHTEGAHKEAETRELDICSLGWMKESRHFLVIPMQWQGHIIWGRCIKMCASRYSPKDTMYTNQTRHFHIISSKGNQYFMILCESDNKYIEAEPMKYQTTE